MDPESADVKAAGGVVRDADGRLAVAHRPRYDDWSFPKGKLDAGETWEQAALREVREEIGVPCGSVASCRARSTTSRAGARSCATG